MKPKPVVFIADPHFHNWKSHSTIIAGENSRLLDGIGCFRTAIDIAKKNDAKTICIAGDIFHVRGNLKPSVLSAVASVFQEAVNKGIDILIIPGNHDMENLRGGATAVDTLNSICCRGVGVRVATSPDMLEFNGIEFGVIPYIHDTEEFKETLYRMTAEVSPDIIMMHQGIDEFRPDMGMPETGITVKYLEANVPEKTFVFAGHYHFPKRSGRIVSVGSLYQQTFGAEGIQMGCWVWYPELDYTAFQGIPSPEFMTVDDKFCDFDEVKGNIVRVKVKTAHRGELMIDRLLAAGAISATAILEKEFTTAHVRTIKLSTPTKMFDEFISSDPRYQANRERLNELFQKICLNP